MGFLLWFISTFAVLFVLFIVFQLDDKFLYGAVRDIVQGSWILYLILIIFPVINIIVCALSVIVFLIMLIVVKIDDYNLDGGDIIKKIFFIKDDK
jgi:hypothetical protein